MFFLLLFATLLAEGLMVADKFLFRRIIDDGNLFLEGTILQNVFVKTLIIIAVIYIIILLVRSASRLLIHHLLMHLDNKLILELKNKYFGHIIDLSHEFHTTHKTGSMVSRMIRGAGAMENMTDIFVFNFVPLVFSLLIVGISLATISLTPAIVIAIITITFVIFNYKILSAQQKHKLRYNRAEDREKGMISDVFTNIDSVKYFGKENVIKKQYGAKAEFARRMGLKYWGYFRWMSAGQALILGIGAFALLYFPILQFINKEITLGTLVFIYTIYGNVVGPMFGFVHGIRGFYKSMADFQDLFEYGKVKNEIKDKYRARNLIIKKGTINFKNVNFSYGTRKLFKNFNLKIEKNEKIALVGHSGSGKTTLVKLLNRFYDVESGVIYIDEKDIRNFKQESVREETGIVPQECILFDDTVYNNIKFADLKASRKEVMKAIRLSRLDKVIKNFPKKENTIVGERGVKLSGGEKQRVSIARAILANKRILILDEATSSLDSETEYEIQQALKELLQGRTAIMIAHRLSTIMNSDRIIVLKNGKIIQEGKHADLIKVSGEYRKLWELQKGGYIG